LSRHILQRDGFAIAYAAARTDKRSPEKNQPVESGVGTNFGVGDRQGEAYFFVHVSGNNNIFLRLTV